MSKEGTFHGRTMITLVTKPQPDGSYYLTIRVHGRRECLEPWRAPENRGPKCTLRTPGGCESNLQVKKIKVARDKHNKPW